MDATPLADHFAALTAEAFHRGVPWYRAYRRPAIRRRVARLSRARALLAESRLFAPWNPVLHVWAGQVLDGRFTDPRVHCDLCGRTQGVPVISRDPLAVAREAVHVGRRHRIECGRTPITTDRKDTA